MAASVSWRLSIIGSVRPGPLALLLVIAAACGAAACGRTELDVIPDDGGAGPGGAGGAAGRGGAGGVTGAGGQTPVPVPCGPTSCVPGTQTCCNQGNMQTCIPAQASCAGASFSCLEGAACGAGNFCCLSLTSGSTSCTTQQTLRSGSGDAGVPATGNARARAAALPHRGDRRLLHPVLSLTGPAPPNMQLTAGLRDP